MTTKSSGTNQTAYAWDFENRLSSVTLPNNAGVVSFRDDPFGRRIQKSWPNAATNSTVVRNYVYDGANIIAELNASGATVASYTQGAGIDEPLAMRRGGYIGYYNADGLGSITSLTNASAQIVATYAYDSFGNTTATEEFSNPYRYTGREQDPETGLYYYRARYYDPTIGRFISEDPMQFGGSGTNFYAYVRNSSINLTDPLGLCDKKPSCLQVFWNAFKDAMNPFGPSLSSLSDPLAAYLSAQQWNAAMEYAATKGLLYPLKSSVFRSKIASSATTAGAGFLIGVDLSLAQALWAEYQAAAAGECQ
jgi:RHS repeat-associated protein